MFTGICYEHNRVLAETLAAAAVGAHVGETTGRGHQEPQPPSTCRATGVPVVEGRVEPVQGNARPWPGLIGYVNGVLEGLRVLLGGAVRMPQVPQRTSALAREVTVQDSCDPDLPEDTRAAADMLDGKGVLTSPGWENIPITPEQNRIRFARRVALEVRAEIGYLPEFTSDEELMVSKRVYEYLDRIHCRKSHQPMHAPMAILLVFKPTKWDVERRQLEATIEMEAAMREGHGTWESDYQMPGWLASFLPGVAKRLNNAQRARRGQVPVYGTGMQRKMR